MQKRHTILSAVLILVIIGCATAAWLVWRHQQFAALTAVNVPEIPDLSQKKMIGCISGVLHRGTSCYLIPPKIFNLDSIPNENDAGRGMEFTKSKGAAGAIMKIL